MKKIMTVLVALGIILGGGVSVSASSGNSDYDLPVEFVPAPPWAK